MGVVYLARDPFIERDVALKLLRSIDDDDAHERFQREIRIAGALTHPNIVRIYDAGTHEGQPFVAMEYVAGETMAEIIKRGAPIDLDRKLELLIDLTEGLGYAHKRGVIHRDIKPSNLIIDEHGRLKILDFGIARLADAGRTSTSLAGTPSYMAPEQMMGERVDARGDLFSCGIVVYEVVAYTLPFSAPSFYALYNAIRYDDPAPLTSVAPGTPAALDTFIERALAKKPDQRFQTAQAFGDALRAVRATLSAEETVVVAPQPMWSPPTPPAPDPGSGTAGGAGSARPAASKRLAEMRQRQRVAAKEEARRALSEGRLSDALEAAERALLLDETDAGAQELADLARESMDRAEAGRLLEEAQKHLDTGELDQAQQVMQRLGALKSGTPEFAALESQLSRLQREVQRSRRREELLADARRLVGLRDFEGAHDVLVEAVELGAAGDDALSLQATIDAALRERQAAREWLARVREVTAQARALFERDQFDEAIELLEAFTPPHPEPTALLEDVRTRRARVADEQRRRDREQQRQETRSQGLAEVESLLAAGDADAAIARLDGLRSQGFVDSAVEALEHRATDLRLVQANERRRAAALARGLDAARTAMARRDPDAALLVLEQLSSDGFVSSDIDVMTADAEALQQQVARERQEQLEHQRRLARLAAGLQQVREALQRQDAEGALVALRFLRREGLESPDIEDLERQADAMLQEFLRQRQADLERDRRSARFGDGVAAVRAALEAGDHRAAAAALGLLRAEGFDQPELAALESEVRGLQQQTARERVAQLEREQRDGRLAQGTAQVRAAMGARDFDAAFAALGLLRRDGFDVPMVAALELEAQNLQQEVARERFEQLERERRDARLANAVDEIRSALRGRTPEPALATLGLLRRDGFDSPEIAALQEEASALQQQIDHERFEQLERERRRVRLAEELAAVRAAIEKRDPDAAAAAVGLLRRDGFDTEADGVQDEVEALDEDVARQRREHIEREGRASRLTRDAAQIRASLERRDPDAAIAILEALQHDGLSLPDQRKLAKEARKLRDHLLHEQAAAAAESVQKATATQTRTRPGAGTSLPRWLLPAAVVAVLAVGGVAGTWLMSRRAPVPGEKGPAVTVPATPSPATPSSVPGANAERTGSAPAAAAPEAPAEPAAAAVQAPAFEQARRLERRGDLRGAARTLSNLAGKAPQSADAAAAIGRLKELTVESRQRAEQARQRAVAAGASATSEFSAGSRRFEQAARAAARGPVLEGITGFLDAEASFDRSAATTLASAAPTPGLAADVETTSAPVPTSPSAPPVTSGSAVGPLPVTPPRGTDTPTAPVVEPSANLPASTVPVLGAAADQQPIETAVRLYFAARSRLDFARVQDVYPGATDRERTQLRRIEAACSAFSEEALRVEILRHDGSRARVQADVRSTCRPRAGRSGPPNVVDITLTLEKVGSTYRIIQVNRPDQAK